jgi:hypothetical protein
MAITYPTTLDAVVGTGTSGATLSVGGPGGESHVSCHLDMSTALTTLEYNAQAEDTYLIQDHMDFYVAQTALPQSMTTATGYGKNFISATFTGTGAAAARAASTSGHQGQVTLTSGTVAANYSELTQANAVFDIQTGFFPVLSFRAVVLTPATLPTGATGATTYGVFRAGFNDTLHTSTFATGNSIDWIFDPATSGNWQLALTKAGTGTRTASTVALATSTWYDLQIWVGSTGVQARAAVFSPTALPTILAGGPFTTNQPLTSTPMTWHVLNMNGTAGTTSCILTVDLVEVAGLANATAGVTTNFRGAAMTKGF